MSNEFDLKCDELRQKLVEDINSAELPITVIYYILKEILDTAEAKKMQVVSAERYQKMNSKTQDDLVKREDKNGDTE